MADQTPRFMYNNLFWGSGVTLSDSNEQTAFTSVNTTNVMPSKPWRSSVGFNSKGQFNNSLQFTTGDGLRIGYIAPGTYTTGAAYATAAQNAFAAAGFNPRGNTFTGSLTGWYRGDSVVVDSSGNVQTLTDLSGNSRDLTQASAGSRPAWIARAVDNRPGIYFNGTSGSIKLVSSALISAFLGANGIHTIVAVIKLDSDAVASDSICGIDTVAGELSMGWVGGSNFSAQANDGASHVATKTSPAGGVNVLQTIWSLYDHVNISCGASVADDASLVNTAMTGTIANTGTAGFRIGGDTTNIIKGTVMEVMLFNAKLNNTERRGITQYLKARYPSMVDTSSTVVWGVNLGVTYSSTTKLFTIARTLGAGNPSLTVTGTAPTQDAAMSAYKSLGFTSNKTGGTTYTGDTVAYHTQEYFQADLGSANSVTFAAVVGHAALATGGSITLYGNAIDTWDAPTYSTALTGDNRIVLAFIATQSFRFWRIVVDDIQNTNGYSQIGVPWIGTYFQPGRSMSQGYTEGANDLSIFKLADNGAPWQYKKNAPIQWRLVYPRLNSTDKTSFDTMMTTIGVGGSVFLALDPQNFPGYTRYGVIDSVITKTHSVGDGTPPERWSFDVSFLENVG